MTKSETRKYFQEQRSQLSEKEIQAFSSQIFHRWEQSELSCFDSYHIFLSIKRKKEIDTSLFINYLCENNKKVFTSKTVGNELIHFELTSKTQLIENPWGILEPADQEEVNLINVDIVFVPLLAYDLRGNRTGYGKGYYDRFLAKIPTTKKVGLSFFEPISAIDDVSPDDIPLDCVVTPNYLIDFL
ncbi:MAG: 5-formyltetrahydrofolate cyclo-ligase [Flavobacteriaceae bacterium]|jgi:5-formyltetrahydrofolate cyclo-ligase|nr:5-formyltetrahydrofolate cyclo-ligase [Flavobacteriaceae bacterium]